MISKSRLVLVDDSSDFTIMMTRYLENQGYDVIGFNDPRKALAYIQAALSSTRPELRIHCVVTDVQMPEISGFDLVDAVRKIDIGIPVVMMTASPDVRLAIRAMHKEVADYVMKPFQPQEMVAVLERALQVQTLIAPMYGAPKMNPDFIRMDHATSSDEMALGHSALDHVEKAHIEKILKQVHGKREVAARLLGISRKTLYKKILDYGIKADDEAA